MPDVVVSESRINGSGVFATREFHEGETVLIVDDSRLVDESHPLRPELGEYEHHQDYLARGKQVLIPSPERYVNHSCDPNVFYMTVEGARRMITRRTIALGEEITADYILNTYRGDVWQCSCGASRCRKAIVSSFFELPTALQLEYLPELDTWFVREHPEEVERLRSRNSVDPPEAASAYRYKRHLDDQGCQDRRRGGGRERRALPRDIGRYADGNAKRHLGDGVGGDDQADHRQARADFLSLQRENRDVEIERESEHERAGPDEDGRRRRSGGASDARQGPVPGSGENTGRIALLLASLPGAFAGVFTD